MAAARLSAARGKAFQKKRLGEPRSASREMKLFDSAKKNASPFLTHNLLSIICLVSLVTNRMILLVPSGNPFTVTNLEAPLFTIWMT